MVFLALKHLPLEMPIFLVKPWTLLMLSLHLFIHSPLEHMVKLAIFKNHYISEVLNSNSFLSGIHDQLISHKSTDI